MKTKLASILLIIALGIVVYANSINCNFVLDDDLLVKSNIYIRNSVYVPKIFKENITVGAVNMCSSYRPVQILSYMLDYSIWKLNVIGYHLANIKLHILAALCVFWLINILFGDNALALFTSLLFIAHPIHTEAVTYISGRADPLGCLFMLLAFIFYIKAQRAKGIFPYLITLITFSLALLSREGAIIFPVLLLLYHYAFREKIRINTFIPVAALALAYLFLRMTVLKHILSYVTCKTTPIERLPGFFVAVTNYMRLLLAPLDLHMEYGAPVFSILEPKAIIGIFIVAGLAVYAFMKRKTDKITFFAISFFFAALLPQSNLYPINAYMAEHWSYMPSIGFFLLIAKLLSALYKKKGLKVFAIVLIALILTAWSYLTIKQNEAWKDPISFYERAIKYAPRIGRLYNNLGNLYKDNGRVKEAAALYKKAIELEPAYADAYSNLGGIYHQSGKDGEAITLYKKAIELNPYSAEMHYNLGVIYYYTGDMVQAIGQYKKALELNPDIDIAYSNMGAAYYRLGKKVEAIAAFEKAIAINPVHAEAYNNLAVAYLDIGDVKKSIESCNKAIALNPDYASAYYNLSLAYKSRGEVDKANVLLKKAIEKGFESR